MFHHRPLFGSVIIWIGGGTPPSRILRDFSTRFLQIESRVAGIRGKKSQSPLDEPLKVSVAKLGMESVFFLNR